MTQKSWRRPAYYRSDANEEECALLAHRFDQQSVGCLSANLVLGWLGAEEVLSISGRFQAEVVQTCDNAGTGIRRAGRRNQFVFARDIEKSTDLVDPEDAEPLDGDVVDLGELVAEEFSLALDPYPEGPI